MINGQVQAGATATAPMVALTIDGQALEVPEGTSVLDAARTLGIEIPTLCFRPGHDALTSCMVCLVRLKGAPKFVPSCATKVTPGMVVECETDEVRLARKTAIELLLSDHAGDCLAPCQLVCPAHMDIDEMLRQIAARDFRQAVKVVKRNIPLPSCLGRVCPDLCEKGCRRADHDSSVSICRLKRFVGDTDLASGDPYLPEKKPASGKKIAIVGAGPAGLSAAYYLLIEGHDVTVYDARPHAGGNLRYAIDPKILPPEVVDAEAAVIVKMGMKFVGDMPLVVKKDAGQGVTLEELQAGYDAVLIAIGAIDSQLPASVGLKIAGKGIAVDKLTGMTSLKGVFAAGAALSPYRLAVRAVGDGHHVAKAIDMYVRGIKLDEHNDLFSVRLNVLSKAELDVMMQGTCDQPRPEGKTSLDVEQAVREAARCLQCGCAGVHTCELRKIGAEYEANPLRFRGERRQINVCSQHPQVVFEPGKCVACGRCVQITGESGEALGQAYHGRGFEMKIAPPFDASFAEAVATCAQKVVEACPTAAIRWREGKRDRASQK